MIGALKGELAKFEAEYASLAKEFKPGYPPLDIAKAHRRDPAPPEKRNTEEVRKIEVCRRQKQRDRAAGTMEQQKKATLNLKDSAVQYAILAREVDTNKQLYDGVLQRLKEIGVAAEVRRSNIYVMGKAQPPLALLSRKQRHDDAWPLAWAWPASAWPSCSSSSTTP